MFPKADSQAPAFAPGTARERALALLPWLALCVAFSPVWVDLAHTWASQPKHRFALALPVFGLLAWRAAGGCHAQPRRSGALVLAAALGLELLGILGNVAFFARLGLPLGLMGLARLRGTPPLAVAALALWLVPVPDSILLLTSPAFENTWAHVAAELLGRLGSGVTAVGPSLQAGTSRIDLLPGDGGSLLAYQLAAAGWLLALCRGGRLVRAVAGALRGALLALAIQPLAVLVSGALLAAGRPELGRDWLTHGLWLLCAGVALLAAARPVAPRRPAAARAASQPAGAPIPEA